MNSYLRNIAEYILLKNENLLDVLILMPNRRSCEFLQKEIIQKLEDSKTWLPTIISFNDWIIENSSIIRADDLNLLIKLYEKYKSTVDEQITFDSFYSIGKSILNDFNEIDLELIDAQKIYSNLYDIKEIEKKLNLNEDKELKNILSYYFGRVFNDKNECLNNNYLKIWNSFYKLYISFTQSLINDGMGYDDLILRYFCENKIKELNLPKNIYVVGLNILSKSEIKVLEFLKENSNVNFFWDFTSYELDEKSALYNIQNDLRNKFPEPEYSINSFKSTPIDNISFYKFNNEYSQAIYLPKLINLLKNRDTNETQSNNDTVIVLLNENILPFVLNSIDNTESTYVTLAFPITFTESYKFVSLLLNLKSKINNGVVEKNDLINFLYHPFNVNQHFAIENLKYIIKSQHKNNNVNNVNENDDSELKTKDNNDLFNFQKSFDTFLINIHDLKDLPIELVKFLNQTDNLNIVDYLNNLINVLNSYNYLKVSNTDKLVIKKIIDSIRNLNDIVQKSNLSNQIKDPIFIEKLIIESLQSQKLLLKNNSNDPDVFVMGLMETRLLNFSKVIVLSANEEYLPKKNLPYTFILYELRKFFKLPTQERREVVDAYHFFRLIQHAKSVHLCYASNIKGKPSEPSPFLLQLKFLHKVNDYVVLPSLSQKTIKLSDISIQKNDNNLWKDFINKNKIELSRIDISSFLICPLKFYLSKIYKKTEILKNRDYYIDVGNFTQFLFNNLYFEENTINNKIIDTIIQKLKKIPFNNLSIYEQIIYLKSINNLKNILMLLKNLEANITIINVDKRYEVTNNNITLHGRPDLIFSLNNNKEIMHVLDIKTGNFKEQVIESIDAIFDSDLHEKFVNAFQLFFYSYLLLSKETKYECVYSGNIFALGNKKKKTINLEDGLLKMKNNNEIINIVKEIKNFKEKLENTLKDIFNNSNQFNQTNNSKVCSKCQFNRVVCNKV